MLSPLSLAVRSRFACDGFGGAFLFTGVLYTKKF